MSGQSSSSPAEAVRGEGQQAEGDAESNKDVVAGGGSLSSTVASNSFQSCQFGVLFIFICTFFFHNLLFGKYFPFMINPKMFEMTSKLLEDTLPLYYVDQVSTSVRAAR